MFVVDKEDKFTAKPLLNLLLTFAFFMTFAHLESYFDLLSFGRVIITPNHCVFIIYALKLFLVDLDLVF